MIYKNELLKNSKVLIEDAKENIFYDFTTLDIEQLEMCVDQACQEGDLNLLRYLLTSDELEDKPTAHGKYYSTCGSENEIPLQFAVANGHKDIVKYLCNSREIEEHANIRFFNDYLFTVVGRTKDISMLEFLLNSEELNQHLEVTEDLLSTLCAYGSSLEIIKYLLNHPVYKKIIDINHNYSVALEDACVLGEKETVEYLLTSDDLDQKAQLMIDKRDYLFSALRHNKTEVADYLLNKTIYKDYFEKEENLKEIRFLCNNECLPALEYLLFSYDASEEHKMKIAEQVCKYFDKESGLMAEKIVYEWCIPYTENIKGLLNDLFPLKKLFEKRELGYFLESNMKNKENKKRTIKI